MSRGRLGSAERHRRGRAAPAERVGGVSGAWGACSRSCHKQPGAQRDTRKALLRDGHIYTWFVVIVTGRYTSNSLNCLQVSVYQFPVAKGWGWGGKGKPKQESIV